MNAEIKALIKKSGIRQWEIAEYLDMSETTFCRKMRHELDPDLRTQVIEAINVLAQKNAAAKMRGADFMALAVNK